MAKAFTGFKADSGKIFDTEHDAWKDDLRAWLVGSDAINEGHAKSLIETMTTKLDRMREFVTILDRVAATHPELPEDGTLTDIKDCKHDPMHRVQRPVTGEQLPHTFCAICDHDFGRVNFPPPWVMTPQAQKQQPASEPTPKLTGRCMRRDGFVCACNTNSERLHCNHWHNA